LHFRRKRTLAPGSIAGAMAAEVEDGSTDGVEEAVGAGSTAAAVAVADGLTAGAMAAEVDGSIDGK
jgi:hypothetical protein